MLQKHSVPLDQTLKVLLYIFWISLMNSWYHEYFGLQVLNFFSFDKIDVEDLCKVLLFLLLILYILNCSFHILQDFLIWFWCSLTLDCILNILTRRIMSWAHAPALKYFTQYACSVDFNLAVISLLWQWGAHYFVRLPAGFCNVLANRPANSPKK